MLRSLRCTPRGGTGEGRELGFIDRVKGSHHIFTKTGVSEILNLQPRGSLAKPYQVKQVRAVIVRYKMAEETE